MKKWLQGKRRRYSGNDRHFGPITWSVSSGGYNPLGIVLDSGDEEDTCHLRIYLRSRTLIIELPQVVQPYRKRHKATTWDAETIARMGRDWWEETFSREYGIQCSDGFLQVFLGRQTHSSEDTQSWSYFLPWTQWRHIRFSLYDTTGAHFWTQMDSERGKGIKSFDAQREAEKACPKVAFRFVDYDGAKITASTHINEREWRRGEKWCSWLSLFYRPMVKRSLDIHYSAEVGPRKGSWKGGTIGCGMNMLPGELHEEAFVRHCIKENLTYIGHASEAKRATE